MAQLNTPDWSDPDDRRTGHRGTGDPAARRSAARHTAVDPDGVRYDSSGRPGGGRAGEPGRPDGGRAGEPSGDRDRALDSGRTGRRRADRSTDEPTGGTPVVAKPAGGAPPATGPRGSDAPKKSRAGRNLPAAIGVGLTLGAVVIVSLFVWRPAFLGVVTIAAGIGIWEMVRAVEHQGPRAPLLPLLAGAVVMEALAWYDGAEALILGLILTVLAAMVWRIADGVRGYQRDIVVYVPFLAGYAVLLARPDDGGVRVIVTLAAVVLSDTGGYVAGVFFGKHPMAPTVSPKKSWEGFAGSVLSTAVGGALLFLFVLDLAWWQGLIFGAVVSTVCVLGDLGESLIKRDLGVKDMSNLLPGHGGLMDRLDSILFAAPTAFLLLTAFSPVSG